MTPSLSRDLIHALLAALETMPVVVLTGMRQTGKSTLLTSARRLSGRRYVTLGTDGFGRSDTRAALREFFQVDAASIARSAREALRLA